MDHERCANINSKKLESKETSGFITVIHFMSALYKLLKHNSLLSPVALISGHITAFEDSADNWSGTGG